LLRDADRLGGRSARATSGVGALRRAADADFGAATRPGSGGRARGARLAPLAVRQHTPDPTRGRARDRGARALGRLPRPVGAEPGAASLSVEVASAAPRLRARARA